LFFFLSPYHIPFVFLLIIPLWIYFSSFLVFVLLSRSLSGWELKGVEVEVWKPGGPGWGQLWHLSQRRSRQKGKGKEESKSHLERGFGFYLFIYL
jgi:hypothetical protein